jgi:hypothetical protein
MSHLAQGLVRSTGIDSKANGAGRRHAMPCVRGVGVGGGAKRGGGDMATGDFHAH